MAAPHPRAPCSLLLLLWGGGCRPLTQNRARALGQGRRRVPLIPVLKIARAARPARGQLSPGRGTQTDGPHTLGPWPSPPARGTPKASVCGGHGPRSPWLFPKLDPGTVPALPLTGNGGGPGTFPEGEKASAAWGQGRGGGNTGVPYHSHPALPLPIETPGSKMGGDVGCRALLAALLWIPFLGVTAGDRAEDGQDGFQGPADANAANAAGDLLSRLGRAAWATLESWVGPQPLQLVAEVRSRPHGTHEGAIPGGAGTGGGGGLRPTHRPPTLPPDPSSGAVSPRRASPQPSGSCPRGSRQP